MKLPVSKLMPKYRGVDGLYKLEHLGGVEIDVVLVGQLDALLGRFLGRLDEHLGELFEHGTVGFVPKHETRAYDPHDIRPYGLRIRYRLQHFLECLFVASTLEAIRMTPGEDAIELVFVEHPLDLREISGVELRDETGLQGNTVDAELSGAGEEVRELHPRAGISLVIVDFAEKAMVAIAVDPNFHYIASFRSHEAGTVFPKQPAYY